MRTIKVLAISSSANQAFAVSMMASSVSMAMSLLAHSINYYGYAVVANAVHAIGWHIATFITLMVLLAWLKPLFTIIWLACMVATASLFGQLATQFAIHWTGEVRHADGYATAYYLIAVTAAHCMIAVCCVVLLWSVRPVLWETIGQTGTLCNRCAYDLVGLDVVRCPECGVSNPKTERGVRRMMRTLRLLAWRRRLLILLACEVLLLGGVLASRLMLQTV